MLMCILVNLNLALLLNLVWVQLCDSFQSSILTDWIGHCTNTWSRCEDTSLAYQTFQEHVQGLWRSVAGKKHKKASFLFFYLLSKHILKQFQKYQFQIVVFQSEYQPRIVKQMVDNFPYRLMHKIKTDKKSSKDGENVGNEDVLVCQVHHFYKQLQWGKHGRIPFFNTYLFLNEDKHQTSIRFGL